jgi:hypothetical protein
VKNAVKLSILVIIILLSITISVYAASSCKITLTTTKDEFSKDEEFVVDVVVSDIQNERGIIAFGAELEYDKSCLTLVKMEGENGWSTPSYNEENGKLVTDSNKLKTDDESIFKMTFKVIATTTNTEIKLNNISVADGKSTMDVDSSKLTIKTTTKANSTTNTNQNTVTENNNAETTQNPTTELNTVTINKIANSTKNNTVADTPTSGTLPFTGVRNTILIIVVAILVVNCIIIRKKLAK